MKKELFQHLLGNDPIKAYLQRALINGSLHHTLLFSGLEGIGKSLFAKELARELLQSTETRIQKEMHPDLHILRPDPKSGWHLIEEIRKLIAEVHRPPFEAARKVFILLEAERMQPVSANALLKTLEEPDIDSTLLLITASPHEILSTILSRTLHLVFQPLSKRELITFLQKQKNLSFERAEQIARRSHGSLSTALRLLEQVEEEKIGRLFLDALDRKIPADDAVLEIEHLFEALDGLELRHQFERLFAMFLMSARDCELRKERGNPDLLYNPENTLHLSLERAQEKVYKAKLALERNIRPGACLDFLIEG